MPLVPMTLDSTTAIKMNMGGSMFQERMLMGRSDVWHEIKVLRGTLYDKETVLKSILTAIEPADMIPVKYQANGEDTVFLARNCAHALDKLCKTNLIIKIPDGDPLHLVVTLGFASVHDLKINMQPLLRTALEGRYNAKKRSLNLEQFRRDPEMSKTIYSPLSQPKVFNYVLKLAKTSIGPVEHLNLQKNELYSLTAMNGLNLTTIKHLDLRHNNLMNMDVLTPLKGMPISKLWLDGNPLCENYSKPQRYIDSALKYCPSLAQLDGVLVGTPEVLRTYTSYFKNESREELAIKFVHHFFNLYDHSDRLTLRGLYYKNAFYSMSFGIPHAVAHKRKLTQFTASRNLMKNVDATKKRQHLYYGQDNILASLKRLPKSYHDKNSFVLDVLYDDGKCLTINVSGLFKNAFGTSQVLWFSRTFIVQASDNCEYNVVNDQYYVDATMEEIPASSIDSQIPYDELPTNASCFSTREKQEMLDKLAEVTTLNEEWCNTYLEESKWDLRKAITNFMKDYSSSSIPASAF